MEREQFNNSCAKNLCRHVTANIGVDKYIKDGKGQITPPKEKSALDSYL